jgi:transposase-like protein
MGCWPRVHGVVGHDDVWMVDVDVTGVLGAGPRRRRSAVERRRIVEETLEAGASVARIAMKYGVNANQVFQWRRLYSQGKLGATLLGEPKHETWMRPASAIATESKLVGFWRRSPDMILVSV